MACLEIGSFLGEKFRFKEVGAESRGRDDSPGRSLEALERVRELPLLDPATKATNSSSEAMLRRGTGVSSRGGTLDKTLPSTHVKIWSQNQLEERAKLEVDLLFGSSDRPPFLPLPRLLLCFSPCSLISRLGLSGPLSLTQERLACPLSQSSRPPCFPLQPFRPFRILSPPPPSGRWAPRVSEPS